MIFTIIGIIATIWLALFLIFNIAVYINFKITKDSKYVCITNDTFFVKDEYNMLYIIPTIGFRLEFNEYSYPTFEIKWLKYNFNISYHIKSEIEEEAEMIARHELKNKNNES